MRFVDEVYSLYRDQLGDDEEDVVSIVLSILEEQSREDILRLIEEMDDDEVMQMMGVYLVEMLKMRMAQEGNSHFGNLHLPPLIITNPLHIDSMTTEQLYHLPSHNINCK